VPKRASLFTRVPARLAPWLLALSPLACAEEPPTEPDDHVAVKLTFDQITYVDATLGPRKVAERVRTQVQSIFPALRQADVLILANQQVDLEAAQLKKDPVTVVNPATGATRAAFRVHHRYVTLAQVPKALAERGEIPLGVLHSPGPHAEAVLADCTANGERERLEVAELWTVFDPSLASCAVAMKREQAAIDVARRKLPHPEREIASLELERAYLPVTVHVQVRRPAQGGDAARVTPPAPTPEADAGDYALPREGEHVDDPTVRIHADPSMPGTPPGPGEQPAFVIIDRTEEKLAAEHLDQDSEDEAELRRQARALGGDGVAAPAIPSHGGYTYLQPNYAILYVAIITFVLLVVGKRRQRRKR